MIKRPKRNIHLLAGLSRPQRETFGLYLGKLRLKRRDQEEEKEVSGRGECWGGKRVKTVAAEAGNSSRQEDVWAGEVHSVCECNYCRRLKSECWIKLPLLWPHFIQRALYSQHRAPTKAGVPAERGAITSGESKAAKLTPDSAAAALQLSAEYGDVTCFSEPPRVCNQNPPTEPPLVPCPMSEPDDVWRPALGNF